MISKIICLAALIAAVSSQYGHDHGHGHAYSSQFIHRHDGPAYEVKIPVHDKHRHQHYVVDYVTYPKYEFGYQVRDPHTHDYKSQHETRDGDVVKGYYELKEPGGSIRKVEYHGDKKSGFHASVKHETHHIVPEKHHEKQHHQY